MKMPNKEKMTTRRLRFGALVSGGRPGEGDAALVSAPLPPSNLLLITCAEDELIGGQSPIITSNGNKIVLWSRFDAPHPAVPLSDLGEEYTIPRVELDGSVGSRGARGSGSLGNRDCSGRPPA